MVLSAYMSSVVKEMQYKSKLIRSNFSKHRLSAGENREDIIINFLENHLPKKIWRK